MFRLTKIFRLIKNEMIKLLRRKSIWVMIALTLVISVGMAVLFDISREKDENEDRDFLVEEWKHEITQLERFFAKDHYFGDRYADETQRGMQYRNRSEMLQYLVDNEYSPYDWRYTSGIIEELYDLKLKMQIKYNYEQSKAKHDELEAMIQNDDWKPYYKQLAEKMLDENMHLYPMAAKEVEDAAWFEYNYRIENDFKPGDELWRDELIASVANFKLSLAYLAQQEYERTHPGYIPPSTGDSTMEKPDLSLEMVEINRAAVNDKLAVATYRLEKNIKTDVGYIFGEEPIVAAGGDSLFWESFAASSKYIIVAGVLVIIVAGLIVASEFSSGTIKFLLVSPVKRSKIVTAKYITVLLLALMLTALMYVSSVVASLAVFGGYGFNDVIVRARDGVAWGVSPFLKVLSDYGWAFIEVVVVATMAFALSSIMRSTAVSIGVGLFAYLSGTALAELFASFGIDFGRYLLFSNLDLPAIISGTPIFPNQTLVGAIVNIVAHMIVFVLAAWDGFVRREI